jgi:hypothetical protein
VVDVGRSHGELRGGEEGRRAWSVEASFTDHEVIVAVLPDGPATLDALPDRPAALGVLPDGPATLDVLPDGPPARRAPTSWRVYRSG